MFTLPSCDQECLTPLPHSAHVFLIITCFHLQVWPALTIMAEFPNTHHSTCDQKPFHESVHRYKTQLLTNLPVCWPVWPLAFGATVIDISAPERMSPRNRCSYTSKVIGGYLGKGTDILACRKKDYWVKKVERGMTADAPNLGTPFCRGGRRDWKCNFSLGSEWHLILQWL